MDTKQQKYARNTTVNVREVKIGLHENGNAKLKPEYISVRPKEKLLA